jgi:hypothetical protein
MPIHAAGGFSQLAGATFGRTTQEALHARGRADAAAGAHVWAFMQGRGGEVYMQSPPVSFDGGDWVATNLRIGEPVARVLFVQVDEATHARLADKASRQDWSPSPQLPEGARTLASIGLR